MLVEMVKRKEGTSFSMITTFNIGFKGCYLISIA